MEKILINQGFLQRNAAIDILRALTMFLMIFVNDLWTIKGYPNWFNLISIAGTATLTCYLIPYIAYSLASIFHIRLPEFMHYGIPGILSCIGFSLLIIGIAWLIGKIHVKLKI